MTQPCPCGSAREYLNCCGALHAGAAAPSAEALMRSRYSAFVLANERYLLASWHPSTRPATVALDSSVRWLGLSIRATREIDATHAEVEFIARMRSGGAAAIRQHERSRFVHEDGHWYYLDGVEPDPPHAHDTQRSRHLI